MADIFALTTTGGGTTLFAVDDTGVVTAGTSAKADVVAEKTSGAGVTVDGLLLKDGNVQAAWLVNATVACADGTGGTNTAALTVQLKDLNGNNITSARQVLLCSNTIQYSFGPAASANSSLTLGTVTAGSVVATPLAGCLWLIETSATGAFACTATNTDDETVYFFVASASSASDTTKGCIVVASNSDSAAWSA